MDISLSRNQADSAIRLDNFHSFLKVLVAVPHSGSFGFICPVSDTGKEQIKVFI